MAEKESIYNKFVNRELFVLGTDDFAQMIQKVIDPLPFLKRTDTKLIKKTRQEMCFVIADANFNHHKSLQQIVTKFQDIHDANAHKIIFASEPEVISQEMSLFGVEIGARFIVSGKSKDVDLRAYLKKVSVQAEQVGSIAHYENEITRLIRKSDSNGLIALDDRLTQIGRDTEEVLRLKVIINQRLSRFKKAESYLTRILTVNPLNLWAANELGKLYLRTRRPAEGVAVLEKLSRFNDLNGERLLELGTAYLNAGDSSRAEAVLNKGASLSEGSDARFQESIAKAKLLKGDTAGAGKVLNNSGFSEQMLSFLNMRAIMAIKTQHFEEGVKLYKTAINGCIQQPLLQARLYYNMALGCVRTDKIADAAAYFEQSVNLGGAKFDKARKPLEITKKILKKFPDAKASQAALAEAEEFEFEEFDPQLSGKKAS
jgi:tetratricopeptide (TPR) repeat protein